jgi:hypothetical protein
LALKPLLIGSNFSSIRGFLRPAFELLFLLLSFFPAPLLSCVASHLQPKDQVFVLDRALLLLNSQWLLLVSASTCVYFLLSLNHLTSPYQLHQELLPTFSAL